MYFADKLYVKPIFLSFVLVSWKVFIKEGVKILAFVAEIPVTLESDVTYSDT